MGGCAQQSFTTPSINEPARKDVVIQFGNASVDPSIAKVLAGGSVTWSNTSDSYGVVRFPMADKSKFTCKAELRPDWQQVANAIESLPMASDAEDIVFPCALQPGSYPYKIDLFGNVSQMDNPAFTLSGTLQVE
jgi:hypothetical protein